MHPFIPHYTMSIQKRQQDYRHVLGSAARPVTSERFVFEVRINMRTQYVPSDQSCIGMKYLSHFCWIRGLNTFFMPTHTQYVIQKEIMTIYFQIICLFGNSMTAQVVKRLYIPRLHRTDMQKYFTNLKSLRICAYMEAAHSCVNTWIKHDHDVDVHWSIYI